MSLRWAFEGAVGAKTFWLGELGIGTEDFDHLVANRIFQPTPSGNEFVLNFVGVVLTKTSTIAALPKFSDAKRFTFCDLLRILRVYFEGSDARSAYETAVNDLHFPDAFVAREFDSFLALLHWYKENGAYRNEQQVSSAVSGRIDWGRTIAKKQALLSLGAVLYPEPLTVRRRALEGKIAALQLAITAMLSERYGYSSPHEIYGSSSHALDAPDITDVHVRRVALEQVAQERKGAFRADRLLLLDLLEGVLRNQTKLAGPHGIRIFGTTAFYNVWEDACRVFFTQQNLQSAPDLAQPVWRVYQHTEFKSELPGGKQRPDILVALEEGCLIVDAKYYYPFPAARPGWSDIAKQLYYGDSLPPETKLIANCFLMPGDGETTFTFRGTVEMDKQGARPFPKIEVWEVDPYLVLSAYSSGDAATRDGFARFVGARSIVPKLISNAELAVH